MRFGRTVVEIMDFSDFFKMAAVRHLRFVLHQFGPISSANSKHRSQAFTFMTGR